MSRTSKNTSDSIEQIKEDLLSLVSHELRTPLSSVLNAVRLLREEQGLPLSEKQNLLEMAHRNAELLNAKLNQLLDLSKLVSGRLVCRFQEVSLKNMVIRLLERLVTDGELGDFDVQINSASRALSGQIESHLTELPAILADAIRLEHVISAVFSNAMKFSPPRGKIAVKVRNGVKASALPPDLKSDATAKGEYVLIEVSNHVAPSVRSEHKDVFKVFAMPERFLAREQEGLGGSLAIASEVMRQHGGIIHVSETPEDERGRFVVHIALPILDSQAAFMKVLESRMFALKTEVGALSLIVFQVQANEVKHVHEALKGALFRATDTVYTLPDFQQVAVVLDDCKKQDAPKIVRRLVATVSTELAHLLDTATVGLASCPDDGSDPEKLVALARAQLLPFKQL